MPQEPARRGFTVDEDTQMRTIEEMLLERFEGVDRTTICGKIERAKADFANARVRTFVPLLVQRAVTEDLRHTPVSH